MRLILAFVLVYVITVSNQTGLESSILCYADYCQKKQSSNDPILCPKMSKKCLEKKGYFVPSPVTCNCCEYCIEHLDEGDTCSVGSESGLTANAICGPGLFCDPSTNKCVKFVDISDEKLMSKCVKAQHEYDKKKLEGTLGFMEMRPYCDEHGEFEPYQCVPGQICFCVDKDGNRIFGEVDFNSSPQYILRCGCSRAYRTAENAIGRKIQPGEHFRCTEDGDFDKVQCIGDKCLCVDNYDGSPLYPDEDFANVTSLSPRTLKCIDPKHYNEEEGYEYYKKCEGEYIYLKKQIDEYKKEGYEAVFSYKLPNCDLDGGYSIVQIDEEKGIKYCSHPNGTIMEPYKVNNISNITDADEMDCKCAKARIITSSNEKPDCQPNGNYKKIQCRRGKCYCVNSDGQQIQMEVDEEVRDTLKC